MKIYKSGKLVFDKDKNGYSINRRNQSIFREFGFPTIATKFKMELLEISLISNPSDIEIEITLNFSKKRLIKLYQVRTDFIFQNGFFILDTKYKEPFQIDFPEIADPEFDFTVKIISESDFKMTIYYSTDQENKFFHYQIV